MAINLDQHKVYVDSLKMEMVPYSIAIQALQEAVDVDTTSYAQELENVMKELRNSLNNIKLDD
jgi:hypothetical protein